MSKPWGGLGGVGALREAAAGKPKKKGKGTTLSLSEFAGYGPGRRQAAPPEPPRGLTAAEMMMLPTGPRERSADELDRPRGLGGGFRSYGSGDRGGGGGFDDDARRGSDLDVRSRADEDRDWSMSKKSFAPSPADSGPRSRYGGLGGGVPASVGRADDDGDWSRGKKPLPAAPSRYPSLGSGGGFRDSPVSADSDDRCRPTSSHSTRPESAHSSRPGSPGSQVSAAGSEGAPRARPKVNPFGDAKPREVVLQEKGKDWRKIDLELEHRRIDRPETNEESVLKEEINLLKVELNESEGKISDDDAKGLSEKITQMEKQLELLIIAMDDKIRFSQRPGSGAGRVIASPPTSFPDESQIKESMERPHSRSGTEHYPKPTEERWGFQGSRDRGSFGVGRSSDRSSAGQRW
ncbi:hypothetical protein BS78_04G183300 [Paspalum vaginatum]|nr:hypothetical protein BS78_04G183300 [Paspalum vaginatum]